jgi:hypothetical protein
MMRSITLLAAAGSLAAASPYAPRPPSQTIEPSLTQIEQSAATALSRSPVSNVKGAVFNRFYQIWLENTDYVCQNSTMLEHLKSLTLLQSAAAGDPNQQFLACRRNLIHKSLQKYTLTVV